MVPPELGFPLPDALDKFVPAERALIDLLLGKPAGHDDLGGDAGVVGAGLPQRVSPTHALEANEDVLQCEVERVAHMQAPRHVGGRHHDRIGRLGAVGVGGEGARGFPLRVPACLHRGWFKGLFQHPETVFG